MKDFRIIYYLPAHQKEFERLNRNWIEQYFSLESIDVEMFRHPEKYFKRILCALVDNKVIGVAALRKTSGNEYELSKMAVDEQFRGKKIGLKLCEKAIEVSRNDSKDRLILYSNTKLIPAISIYKKLGFKEIPNSENTYKRSNIKMVLEL